ncbi:MAG: lipoyl(octanoyl) transferase LipB [Balneolaceae bacterium]
MANRIEVYDTGHLPYREAWQLQRELQGRLVQEKLKRRKNPALPAENADLLLYTEHSHVYTLGKSGNAAHLLRSMAELKKLEAEFVEIDRGGDITYHGPGQIVGYPILDLGRYFTDIHRYLRSLEEVVIRTCADFGLKGEREEGLTGVWIGGKKVCALGIRCSRWVTMHGFALNVNTDLTWFNHIVPCGINDRSVATLSGLAGQKLDEEEVKKALTRHFGDVFEAEMVPVAGMPESD